MLWFLGFYLYVCVMFSIWYVRWRRAQPSGTSSSAPFGGRDWELSAVFFTILICWWYWPLMVFYVVENYRAKEAAKLEHFKNNHRI